MSNNLKGKTGDEMFTGALKSSQESRKLLIAKNLKSRKQTNNKSPLPGFTDWFCVWVFLYSLARLFAFCLHLHFLFVLSLEMKAEDLLMSSLCHVSCPGYIHVFLSYPLYTGTFECPNFLKKLLSFSSQVLACLLFASTVILHQVAAVCSFSLQHFWGLPSM